MYLIHNSTGGRIPKYWRPPYGDSDNRVSAIAKEVFGLRTVIWNQECAPHPPIFLLKIRFTNAYVARRTGTSGTTA